MVDPGFCTLSSKDKAMSAAQELEAGDQPHLFVAIEFTQLMLDFPETSDFQLETRAVADLSV